MEIKVIGGIGGDLVDDGAARCYLLVDGNTLLECVEKSTKFIGGLSAIGINVTPNELAIVSDFFVYGSRSN